MKLAHTTELDVTKTRRWDGPEMTCCLRVAFSVSSRWMKSSLRFSSCSSLLSFSPTCTIVEIDGWFSITLVMSSTLASGKQRVFAAGKDAWRMMDEPTTRTSGGEGLPNDVLRGLFWLDWDTVGDGFWTEVGPEGVVTFQGNVVLLKGGATDGETPCAAVRGGSFFQKQQLSRRVLAVGIGAYNQDLLKLETCFQDAVLLQFCGAEWQQSHDNYNTWLIVWLIALAQME